ncbi:hypothetical protein D3C73_1216010 [compost metagenome]
MKAWLGRFVESKVVTPSGETLLRPEMREKPRASLMIAERVERPIDSTALPRPSSRLPPTVTVKLSVVPSPRSV